MTTHFHRDLDRLTRQVLSLAGLVEEMIDKATLSLIERRFDVAEEVIDAQAVARAHRRAA